MVVKTKRTYLSQMRTDRKSREATKIPRKERPATRVIPDQPNLKPETTLVHPARRDRIYRLRQLAKALRAPIPRTRDSVAEPDDKRMSLRRRSSPQD